MLGVARHMLPPKMLQCCMDSKDDYQGSLLMCQAEVREQPVQVTCKLLNCHTAQAMESASTRLLALRY
eukprot:6174045-Amphidinium_carterae.1